MDNLLIKIINCYKEYINKLNVGLFPDYGELKNAISFVQSGIVDLTLWQFYYDNLEYNENFIDFAVSSPTTPIIITVNTTQSIRIEAESDLTALLGHLPIVTNDNGELYVRMPLLENM